MNPLPRNGRNRGLSFPRHTRVLSHPASTLGVLLVLNLFAMPPIRAADLPGTAGRSYLRVNFTFDGSGSEPEFNNADRQNWDVLHTYAGEIEVEILPEVLGNPPDERSVLAIRTKPGGLNTVMAQRNDVATLSYESHGEGGPSMIYKARESWTAAHPIEARELLLELFLDPARATWTGGIGVGIWEQSLDRESSYEGQASYLEGPKGGFAEELVHHATEPTDRKGPDGFVIDTGRYPKGPTETFFSVVDLAAGLQGGFYTGHTNVVFKTPPGGLGEPWRMSAVLNWTLHDQLPETELIVRSSRYAQWLPSLQADLSPGEPLAFVATVESPTGANLDRVRVKKYTWTLLETSREPGVALNFPLGAKDSDPDLRLVGWTTDPEGQRSEHSPSTGELSSRIEVHPHDWGGWSTLRVEAELEDGRTLRGRLVPAPLSAPETDILIPRRHVQRKVPEHWASRNGVSAKADNEDDEPRPFGKSGADGDGLSVYEEYRGIYVQGEHRSLDPHQKDLVVSNDGGAIADAALSTFEKLSGLQVHRARDSELDAFSKLSVNQNRKDGPTAGPQKGLPIVTSRLTVRPNVLLPPGSRLRNGVRARVPFALPGVAPSVDQKSLLESIVLQQLFQAVGVDRPGPDDHLRYFELQLPPPGGAEAPFMLLLPNTPVVVLDSFGEDVAKKWSARVRRAIDQAPTRVPPGQSPADQDNWVKGRRHHLITFRWLVGEKGGAHSGPDYCVMRDWFADIHRSRLNDPSGRPIYRLTDPHRGAERRGTVLGTTRQGTGVNAPDHLPEPRYGDSDVAAPANQQMIIADHLP